MRVRRRKRRARAARRERRAIPLVGAAPGWMDRLARWGYAAKGVVYLVIGISGLLVALGLAKQVRGSPGAMHAIVRLPLGRALGAAMAVGLFAYAALSLVAAVRDPERNGRGTRGLVVRAVDGGAGVVYAALAASALRLLIDPMHDAGSLSTVMAARVLRMPLGGPAVVLAGVGMIVGAAVLWAKAARGRFTQLLERRRMTPRVAAWIIGLAQAGTAARGVLFALTGGTLARAGWTRDPEAVGDFGDALTWLAARPAGPVLLGVVASGCVSYGVYQIAKARYRRLQLR
jgi:hypothetical protein